MVICITILFSFLYKYFFKLIIIGIRYFRPAGVFPQRTPAKLQHRCAFKKYFDFYFNSVRIRLEIKIENTNKTKKEQGGKSLFF